MITRVALDAMGGDHAPHAIVRGGVLALVDDEQLHLTLVGDRDVISSELRKNNVESDHPRLRIVHASQVVGMDEGPMEGLRNKKDSSILRMTELGAAREVDAVVSAGNTGAFAAAAQLKLKPLPFISRPGIAVTIPSFHGPFVLCDVGANIQAKPRHLYEYAVMASVFAQRVIGVENPRVAVISIGEETGKGTGLVKQTHELLAADSSLRYVGNVEGRELFENKCDVAVCDGFVGNIVLKFVEGLAEGLFRTIAHEFEDEVKEQKDRFLGALDRVWARHDYSRYGGAPLLGIDGACIICHGRSNETAIRNAVRAASRFVQQDLNAVLSRRFSA